MQCMGGGGGGRGGGGCILQLLCYKQEYAVPTLGHAEVSPIYFGLSRIFRLFVMELHHKIVAE